ncbi:MAG: HupE/UreJ family protein [Sandaracinaceae bacterium]|nr:HupE/UreJ family protein [Sandaracinaceae bacterium]
MRPAAIAAAFLLAQLVTQLVVQLPVAHAHRGSGKWLRVEPTTEGAIVEVELELADVAVELGLPEDAPAAAVLARSDAIRAWIARGVRVRAETQECTSQVSAPRAIERDEGARVIVELRFRCSPARGLVLRDQTVFDSDPQHEAYVRERFGSETDARVLRRGRQEVPLGEPPSALALLARFALEGMLHLAGGYDHLLFLLSLVLTAGGLAAREGKRRALGDVAFLVTAFTLGHSVTLIAAALGVVVLPAKLVESVIAGSIVVVALLNVWRPRERREMPWLALGFGLVHGFGFSGVLAELGLPARARVLSLVAFNVGIEAAQLAFVALLIVPLAWMARLRGYERWIVRGGSIAIALLASAWLLERALA